MSGRRADVAPIIAPPPILFLLYLGAAWGADTLFPLRLDGFPLLPRLAGCGLVVAGAAGLGAWAFVVMWRAGTPIEPWEPTRCIVGHGPFRFTRNPLYLALTAMLLAMALAVNSVWFYAGVPALFATLHFGVVLREETYLAERFDGEYEAYRSRTRRWV